MCTIYNMYTIYTQCVHNVHIIAQNSDTIILIIGRRNRKKKISRLASYAFIKAINRGGAYISDNKMGAALCFRSNNNSSNLKEFIAEIRFTLSIPIAKVIHALKREAYLKKHRYQGDHFYFWFLGVKKDGDKAGFGLKDHLFELAQNEQLPILLETSIERNKVIYERYGFTVYHIWENPFEGKPLWFMTNGLK